MKQQASYLPPAQDQPGDVEVIVHPIAALMGGGFAVSQGGRSFIVLDPVLEGPHRQAAMLHELVHLERGLTERADAPLQWQAVAKREELAVEREVAARMIPEPDLQLHLDRAHSLDEGVTAANVAEEFEVPESVAAQALRDLKRPGSHQQESR